MSTSPYSQDLREKVIKYLEQGKSKKEASEVYGLHRNTVSRWYNRYKKEGVVESRKRVGAKARLDKEKFILYVEANPDSSLSEMGKHFNISGAWASIMLKKLGYSYKKKPLPMWKRVKKRG
jgi:transposase